MKFVRDTGAFTGAEKALVLTFGLAIVLLVAALVRGGSQQAGTQARTVLEQGDGTVRDPLATLNIAITPQGVATPGSIGTAGQPQAVTVNAAAPAGGGNQPTADDWERYSAEHRAVQEYFATVIRPGAQIEVPIPGSGPNGGTGRADLVDGNQVWEVKPARPWYMDGTGQAQLNRYLENRPGSVPGQMYNTPVIVPYPGDPTKEIVVQSYGQPGMLYYYVRNRTQPDPRPVPVPDPVPVPQPEDNRVRDGIVIGGVAIAGGAALWWGAKLLSPVCGPAVLLCAAVF